MYLGNVTRVSSSSQNLLDDGVLDFVFLQSGKERAHWQTRRGSTLQGVPIVKPPYHCNDVTEYRNVFGENRQDALTLQNGVSPCENTEGRDGPGILPWIACISLHTPFSRRIDRVKNRLQIDAVFVHAKRPIFALVSLFPCFVHNDSSTIAK